MADTSASNPPDDRPILNLEDTDGSCAGGAQSVGEPVSPRAGDAPQPSQQIDVSRGAFNAVCADRDRGRQALEQISTLVREALMPETPTARFKPERDIPEAANVAQRHQILALLAERDLYRAAIEDALTVPPTE